jgi:ribosomal protein L33
MKFCPLCGSNTTKNTTIDKRIIFVCQCQWSAPGNDSDTLMAEGYTETMENNLRHDIFISNSAHDPARMVVLKSCPQCKIDYLTSILIGSGQVCMYTCTCGYKTTADQYQAAGNQ